MCSSSYPYHHFTFFCLNCLRTEFKLLFSKIEKNWTRERLAKTMFTEYFIIYSVFLKNNSVHLMPWGKKHQKYLHSWIVICEKWSEGFGCGVLRTEKKQQQSKQTLPLVTQFECFLRFHIPIIIGVKKGWSILKTKTESSPCWVCKVLMKQLL